MDVIAFTVRPAPAVEIKSAEVKETLDRAFTRANRYDSGFQLVTSGASLNATLEKGKALIGGASVGIDADSDEAITFASATSNQGVYVKDDGTVVVSTTDPVSGDFIKVWSADTDGTGVTATTNLRDTTLQFGSPIRSTRVVIDDAPTANTHGTNKEYVDDKVASAVVKPVRAASLTNVNLATDVENGDTFGGVTLATGDRIAPLGQSTGTENGIWVVSATGAPTRPDDFNATADVRGGFTFTISEGTLAHREYILTTDDPITVDSTSLTFALHSVEGQKGANSGLATLNGSGVHTVTERPAASTTEKGDALVGTATPGALAAAAAVGASTTRWAREDHRHDHGDRSADVATHHSIAQLSDSGEIIQRDGSVAFTGDQSFGGNKATNLADGTAATDGATVGQSPDFTRILAHSTQPANSGRFVWRAKSGVTSSPRGVRVDNSSTQIVAQGLLDSADSESLTMSPSTLAWDSGDIIEMVCWFKPNSFGSLNTGQLIGVGLSGDGVPDFNKTSVGRRIVVGPDSALNVFAVVGDGSAVTSVDTGVNISGVDWVKVYIKYTIGGDVEITLDDSLVSTISTNVPDRIETGAVGIGTGSGTQFVAVQNAAWRFTPA